MIASSSTENGAARCPAGPASLPGRAIAPPQCRISTVDRSRTSTSRASPKVASVCARMTGAGTYAADAAIQQYFRAEHAAVHAGAIRVFASSVPLAIYAATASARLRSLPSAKVVLTRCGRYATSPASQR